MFHRYNIVIGSGRYFMIRRLVLWNNNLKKRKVAGCILTIAVSYGVFLVVLRRVVFNSRRFGRLCSISIGEWIRSV
jgi:hypothetical protein